MRIALAWVVLAAACAAAPTADTTNRWTAFLLVTTSSAHSATNSSLLPDVNATSLFDPNHQTDFYLRLTAPGYGSLPAFNLTQGTLHTDAQNLLGGYQVQEYNSTAVVASQKLAFDPAPQDPGNLSLQDGYLLAVGGDAEGWTVCQGDLEESIIFWKGNDTSCVKRYIQAVHDPPY